MVDNLKLGAACSERGTGVLPRYHGAGIGHTDASGVSFHLRSKDLPVAAVGYGTNEQTGGGLFASLDLPDLSIEQREPWCILM